MQLAVEEVPRRAVVGERRDRRRREHHHHADDVEHRDASRRAASRSTTVRRRASAAVVGPRAVARWARMALVNAVIASPGRGIAAGSSARSAHLAGEVVAARRRSSRTSRTTRTRATAAPRRRAARARRRVRTASRIESARARPAPRPAKAASTSSAASPIATTARSCGACARSPPRSRPLLRPPAMSTDVLEPAQRAGGGVRVGRLRVVVVAHAAALPHQLHPVREPAEAVERAARPRRGRRRLERGGGRGERVGDVVGCARRRHRGERRAAADRAARTAAHAVAAGAPASPATNRTTRPGASARARRRRGRRALTTSSAVGALVREDRAFACRVRVDDAVPVEVVLGHVEQHRDVGRERGGGERELERRDLGDDHGDVVAGGVEQRTADVAGGDARDARRRAAWRRSAW